MKPLHNTTVSCMLASTGSIYFSQICKAVHRSLMKS